MNPINYISKFFVLAILCVIVLVAATSFVYAQRGKKNLSKPEQSKLWRQVDESSLQSRAQRSDLPEKYLVFRLNQTSLKDSIANLPLENTNAARDENVVMEIPQADGTIQHFRMEETSVLSPELAAQYPS